MNTDLEVAVLFVKMFAYDKDTIHKLASELDKKWSHTQVDALEKLVEEYATLDGDQQRAMLRRIADSIPEHRAKEWMNLRRDLR